MGTRVNMKKINSIFYVVLSVIFLSACQDRSMFDLEGFVKETKEAEKAPIEPLPAPKPHPKFIYSASDYADPFDVTNITPRSEVQYNDPRDPNRRKELLEGFPLDSIRVVGTMAVNAEPWALVGTPDGAVHKIKNGRYIGENDGRVVSIDLGEQKINLIENVKSPTGDWVQREVFLSVSDE